MKPSTKLSKEAQDNAHSLVDDIKKYHQKVLTAQREGYQEALVNAIKCGKALILAKENVKAVKGKWLEWLDKEVGIPQTTANLYTRLAEHEELLNSEKTKKFLDGAGEGLSIRAAAALLPKRKRVASAGKSATSNGVANDEDDEDQDDDNTSGDNQDDDTSESTSGDDSPDLPSMLKDAGVDGTINALTEAFDDTEDLRKIIYDLTALLRKTDPQQFALLDMSLKGAQDAAAAT
jgi:hypothetical protein